MSSSRPHTAPARRNSARLPLPTLPGYVFTERLGSGTYATVYKAFKKTGHRETVAIKCVLKSSLNRTSTENLLTEIELLKLLKHEHIVELKDFEWDDNYIYIITEFCCGGDLLCFLKQKRALHEDLVRTFLQQIALALQYMREKNVSHLDLKPQNILLSGHGKPKIKIADFGFAHYVLGDVKTSYLKGSPLYMAPEIICQKHYDAKADLWSIGVILYECLFGQAPWASNTLSELAAKIKENKPIRIPAGFDVSEECRDLTLQLLIRDPQKRISFEVFFAHPFLELDRIPNDQSLSKAIEIVKKAIEADEQKNVAEAISLYIKSLDYFVGALQHESDEVRRETMRTKIREYLARTEALRETLRTNLERHTTASESLRELEELSSSHPQLPTLLASQGKAAQMEKDHQHREALDRHQRCIQQLLSVASDLPEGRLRELLYTHVQNSLSHAERLSEFIKSGESYKKQKNIKRSITDSVKETCHVQ